MKNLLHQFDLGRDRENYKHVIEDIEKDVVFRGANLWILIFAIFVASLGLNVNSTAVIIGAMLISPLMGPIMGLGMSWGINDLALLRLSLFNYFFAAAVGLSTSTLYFLITPLNAAHSEILARTSPTIYDVLIAFFGGLAGIVAASSKYKGNVIPGVAIATALMPPLCTAGYGLATWHLDYFLGALYLFLINTVFIALATLFAVRLLKFPIKKLQDQAAEARAKRIAWAVVTATLLPSIYLGYGIVQQEKFLQNASRFIQYETAIPNCYLLEKEIDARKKTIVLTYGGKKIGDLELNQLRNKLAYHNLPDAALTVRQGFEYLSESKPLEQINPLKPILAQKEQQLLAVQAVVDSLKSEAAGIEQLGKEARALYPGLVHIAFTGLHSLERPNEPDSGVYLVYLQFAKPPGKSERIQMQNWLETRLQRPLKVVIDQ